jgi:site-specific DNA-cytosine methylase
MDKEIKWGSIIPLIGGMTVGNKKTVGTDPNVIISYEAFGDNDQHCRNYFKDTPYVTVDAVTNTSETDIKSFGSLDFMSTVCPCAGLSQLNSAKNTSKGRGSDALQNEWMYKSASFVLEQIKPKVFWGENAPGLYGKTGEGVVERLRNIGEANGYAFSMVKTDTFLHGIPQHRHRTFYFFWQGERAPILSWYRREAPLLADYLDQIPADAKDMDRYFGMGLTENDSWFRFAASEGFTPKDLVESPKGYKSVFDFVQDERIDKAIAWAEENEETKMLNFLKRAKPRLEAGQGLWVDTPILFREAINSLIGRYTSIVHPTQPRGITVREAMHLMGLPHDFELNSTNVNHICQNVPTTTAADWTAEVVKFVKGEVTEWGGKFVKQNNETQKIDISDNPGKPKVYSIL